MEMREGGARFGLWYVHVRWSGATIYQVRFSRIPLSGPVPEPIGQYLSGKEVDLSMFNCGSVPPGDHYALIYREVQRIPYGETATYSEIAERTGTHARVVGQALARNQIPLIIPCHRVEAEIGQVIARLPSYLTHVICVDDASPDHTAEIVEIAAKNDPRILLLRHKKNQGVGGAMLVSGIVMLASSGTDVELTQSYAPGGMVGRPQARAPRKRPARAPGTPPNILMIGSDTLRADRLGALGYRRALTPHLDQLATSGVLFTNCYVPCARTAPSLISMLTGTWPHTHGVRDNYADDEATRLKVDALPTRLKQVGYRTAAISDWCGADMGKFSFGFDYTDLPEDQWNLKYLIRQGPKDLRLFVSLFTHNRLGRLLLPEIYYLGGVPLTQQMGKRARRLVSRLAESAEPFAATRSPRSLLALW